MCVDRDTIILSFVIGLVITLLTSILTNNIIIGEFPNIRFVSIPIIGVVYYGYPLPWLKQVVVPGAMREIIWIHFVVNIVYWWGLLVLIKVLYPKPTERAIGKVRSAVEMRPMKAPAKRPAKRTKTRKPSKKKSKRKSRRSSESSRSPRRR
jgi:hypothetical protein